MGFRAIFYSCTKRYVGFRVKSKLHLVHISMKVALAFALPCLGQLNREYKQGSEVSGLFRFLQVMAPCPAKAAIPHLMHLAVRGLQLLQTQTL